MINLIRNELTKIFKKKNIYILLVISIAVIAFLNFMFKKQGDGRFYSYPSEGLLSYYREDLKRLDPTKASDNSTYIDVKTQLDTFELMLKYDEKSWQVNMISLYGESYIREMNSLTYAMEKDEQSLKKAKEKYENFVAKLNQDDWRYFAKEEKKEIEQKIAENQKQRKAVVDKTEIAQMEDALYSLNIQKQVVDWRLEKDISYATSYLNEALERYTSNQNIIHEYEKQKEHIHQEKVDYYKSLKIAHLAKYSIENEVDARNTSNNRGVLMNFYDNFDILIVIIIVMVAGSIVSEEFNKGTIKLLLVRPYKRSKILVAKFISCLIVLMITIVALIGIQYLIGGIIQGFDSTQVPAVVYNYHTNQIETMSLIKHLCLTTLAHLPMLILLMTVAFVCSTIFNNTAVSIIVPLLGYIGAPILLELAAAYNIEWLRFFPTLNWDLIPYLFGGISQYPYTTFGFSMIMNIFYFVIILIPTFIIFKRKNIKNV